jgi:hypothetical protein
LEAEQQQQREQELKQRVQEQAMLHEQSFPRLSADDRQTQPSQSQPAPVARAPTFKKAISGPHFTADSSAEIAPNWPALSGTSKSNPSGRSHVAGPVATANPSTFATASMDYLKPDDFKSRNGNLVKMLKEALPDETDFTNFSSSVARFREDEMTAYDFVRLCERTFAPQQFVRVFAEIVYLLPNIKKQNQLTDAYSEIMSRKQFKSVSISRSKRGGRAQVTRASSASSGNNTPSTIQFDKCVHCSQVLSGQDKDAHMATHSADSSQQAFPSLSAATALNATQPNSGPVGGRKGKGRGRGKGKQNGPVPQPRNTMRPTASVWGRK